MQLDKMPLTFKRYVILKNLRKKSHLELSTIKVDNSPRHESPSRKFKRGDTIEMYYIVNIGMHILRIIRI